MNTRLAKTLMAVLLASTPGASLQAATLTVTTDSGETGGPDCTLRDAIDAANTDAASGGCPAGSGADVIELPAGATITLSDTGTCITTSPALIVHSEIAINGNAATVRRNLPATRSIFIVEVGGNLTLRDLTVTGGDIDSCSGSSGGGIKNNGTLTLINSVVSDNRSDLVAGGIYNSGTLVLDHSTVTGNSTYFGGGGIYNAGSASLDHSTVSENGVYEEGGGIYNNGSLTITHSTIRDNASVWAGGGVYNEAGTLTLTDSTVSGNRGTGIWEGSGGYGSGIYNNDTVSITNSTIVGHRDYWFPLYEGSEFINFGTATVTHSTIDGADDGSSIIVVGIKNQGTLTLSNSIVGNHGSSAGCVNQGTFNDDGYNIVEDGSCISAATSSSGAPDLGPLADNGGPTWTLALLPGSIALDAGDCAGGAVTADQRGVARPQGAACDIGAYEAPVPTAAGAVAGLSVDKSGSDLLLSWSADCGLGDGYGIYRGDLAQGYESITWEVCDVAANAATIGMGAPDGEFFLVVPAWNAQEGSYGTSTAGERAAAAGACHLQGPVDACAP